MAPSRIVCVLAVLAVLCVLMVFLVHAIEGPYSVVHGPVTALLSARASAGLRMTIMLAGLSVAHLWTGCTLALLAWPGFSLTDVNIPHSSPECSRMLRC